MTCIQLKKYTIFRMFETYNYFRFLNILKLLNCQPCNENYAREYRRERAGMNKWLSMSSLERYSRQSRKTLREIRNSRLGMQLYRKLIESCVNHILCPPIFLLLSCHFIEQSGNCFLWQILRKKNLSEHEKTKRNKTRNFIHLYI